MAHAAPQRASAAPFFYGRITREESETILRLKEITEGLYLLRESINPLGNYCISVCHNGSIHHYIIEKQTDGQYMVPTGKKFPGPLKLIEHYKNNKDGFITCPSVPCNRSQGQQAVAFRGMTYDDLEKEMITRAKKIKDVDLERALGPMRDHLIKMVARDLHLKQPWYHKRITREEAETRLRRDGLKQGKFLVRQRDDKKTFALTLAHNGEFKHYFIATNSEGKYFIEDGPRFECLIMLVDNYHNKLDGVICKLTEPCPNPLCSQTDVERYQRTCQLIEHLFAPAAPSNLDSLELSPSEEAPRPVRRSLDRKSSRVGVPLPKIPAESCEMDEPPESNNEVHQFSDLDVDLLEDEYMNMRRREKRFEFEPSRLTLQDNLGTGQFGSVVKGLCKMGNRSIPVAIKTLKSETLVPGVEPELYKEAKLMQEFEHKHIVQMIGICKADNIMLVLELAPLGPLNKFLSKNKDMTEADIVKLMLQVSKGMAYLESKKCVHRDLAARNVLLVTKKLAKISDFGMSKALSRDSNYYEAQTVGKWPLKWYDIDCILYWKFDSKSDVWSYGVTMWEALSYGGRPYHKMKCQDIIEFLQNEQRLSKPERCSDSSYKIMRECWETKKSDRPTFLELVSKMEILHQNLLIDVL